MPGALLPSRMRQTRPSGGADAPEPGFVEQIGAGFRTAKDDISYVQDNRLIEAYRPVMTALEDINGKSHWQYKDWLAELNPFANGGLQYDYDNVWSDVVAARRKNPAAFKELPASREEFEKGVLTRDGQRSKDMELLSRGGSMTAQVLGGVGASVFDPVNVATMPIGGASKTVGQAVLREAVINGAIELVQQVPLASARERMGEELTAKEVALNVGAGFLFGGVLGGASKYGADNWDAIKAAPRAAQEALWAKIAPMLPESVRPKMDWDAIGDDMIPDIAEAVIGRDNLTEAQADAIAIVRRENEVSARNPFLMDGAGERTHQENLAEAMQRIFDTAPAAKPVVPTSRGSLIQSTAISTGVVPGDARSVMKSRIKTVESSGRNTARNPNSTALGPYQFLKGTWERLYRSRFGDTGKSSADIAALRTDPRLNEILMDDLMAHNEARLRSAGIAPSAGNLYLAHFAGEAGARKLHRAPPNASAREVLGDAVVNANPFLAKMNAADVINWAASKMGGKGVTVPSASQIVDADPEAALRAELQRRQDQVDQDRAVLEDVAPRPPLIEDEDILPDPIHDGGDIPILATPIEATARPAAIAEPLVPPRLPTETPKEIADMMPKLRAIIRDRSQSLNEPAKLAQALGVDEASLRSGLTELALSREIRMNKKGQFTRLPQDNGPIDILKFIGRAGGLSEDGLNDAGRKIGTKGHALGAGGRDYHKQLIPGSGPLVRKAGRAIDEIGELLHEAGYFGDPQGPRPSEADVLEAIDLAATQGRKIYPFGQGPVEADPVQSGYRQSIFQDEEQEYYTRNLFDEVAEANGYAMDDDAFDAAARIYVTEEVESMDEAVLLMINRELEDLRAAQYFELEDEINAAIEDQFAEAWAKDNGIDPESFDGSAPDTGNAGQGSTAARDADGNIASARQEELEPPYLDEHSLKAFDDPDGPAAKGVGDSLEHDLRASVGIVDRYYRDQELGRLFEEADAAEAAYYESARDGVLLRDMSPIDAALDEQRWDLMQRSRARYYRALGEEAEALKFERELNYPTEDEARRLQDAAGRAENDNAQAGSFDDVLGINRDPIKNPKSVSVFRLRKDAPKPPLASNDIDMRNIVDDPAGDIDPAIAERQAQLAQLKAASPMQAKVDQDSTIGSPLFDAVDQFGFRMDEEGDEVNPFDLLAEIDAEDAMIKTIKDCL